MPLLWFVIEKKKRNKTKKAIAVPDVDFIVDRTAKQNTFVEMNTLPSTSSFHFFYVPTGGSAQYTLRRGILRRRRNRPGQD